LHASWFGLSVEELQHIKQVLAREFFQKNNSIETENNIVYISLLKQIVSLYSCDSQRKIHCNKTNPSQQLISKAHKNNPVGASNHNINRNIEAFLVRLKNETQKPESMYHNESDELLNKFTNIIAQTKDNPNFAAIIDYINTQPIDSILSELHSQSEETLINTINQYKP